jgi:hypothetical protein
VVEVDRIKSKVLEAREVQVSDGSEHLAALEKEFDAQASAGLRELLQHLPKCVAEAYQRFSGEHRAEFVRHVRGQWESLPGEESFAKTVTADSLRIYAGIVKFIKRLFPGGQVGAEKELFGDLKHAWNNLASGYRHSADEFLKLFTEISLLVQILADARARRETLQLFQQGKEPDRALAGLKAYCRRCLDPIITHAIPRSRIYPPVDLPQLSQCAMEVRKGCEQILRGLAGMQKLFAGGNLWLSAYAATNYSDAVRDFFVELVGNRRFVALEKVLWRHLHRRLTNDFGTADGDADLVYLYRASRCRSPGEEQDTPAGTEPATCPPGLVYRKPPIGTFLGSGHLSSVSIEKKGAKNAEPRVVDRTSFSHYVQRRRGEVNRAVSLESLGITIYLSIWQKPRGESA